VGRMTRLLGWHGMDDGSTVTVSTLAARVLLIAEDRKAGEIYRRVLEFVGYEVTQVLNFDDSPEASSDADVIVLCDRAAVTYPGLTDEVIRVPEGTAPDVVVTEVFRRVAPRPGFMALSGDR